MYAQTPSINRNGHTPLHFVGVRLPVNSRSPEQSAPSVAIDEIRRPFAPYLVNPPNPHHLMVEKHQDLLEVWLSGVHSDVGSMFAAGNPAVGHSAEMDRR